MDILLRAGARHGVLGRGCGFVVLMSFVVAQKWVIWRRAADKVAAEAATGPEKMKSTAAPLLLGALPSELLVVLVEDRGRQRQRWRDLARRGS